MGERPHDYDKEFTAWERLCAALYEANRAAIELAFATKHDSDKANAGKLSLRLQSMFEKEWRMYGFRRHQAQEKNSP